MCTAGRKKYVLFFSVAETSNQADFLCAQIKRKLADDWLEPRAQGAVTQK